MNKRIKTVAMPVSSLNYRSDLQVGTSIRGLVNHRVPCIRGLINGEVHLKL